MPELGLSPYTLRHSGASNDFLFKRRTVEEIKSRGRWKSDVSVKWYMKPAFSSWSQVRPEVLAFGDQVQSEIEEIFMNTKVVPPLP